MKTDHKCTRFQDRAGRACAKAHELTHANAVLRPDPGSEGDAAKCPHTCKCRREPENHGTWFRRSITW